MIAHCQQCGLQIRSYILPVRQIEVWTHDLEEPDEDHIPTPYEGTA